MVPPETADTQATMDDLAARFIAIRQAHVQTRVDYAVARKMLETQEAAGAAAVRLIQGAAEAKASALAGPGRSGVAGLGGCVDCRG